MLNCRTLKSDWRQNSLGRDYSHRYGYGLIDAGSLVEMAKDWRSVPPQRNRTATLIDSKINAPLGNFVLS